MNQKEAIEAAKAKGYKFVAMDQDGGWYGYMMEPVILGEMWDIPSAVLPYILLAHDQASAYLGEVSLEWEDSLAEVN